jgi:hypothetical protein
MPGQPGRKTFKVRPTAYKPLGATVFVGETVTFRFRAARACYLTLVDVGADGSVTILFPNRYHPAQERLAPNRWYDIPSAEMGFEFVAEPPAGKEMVVALATEQPLELGQLRLKDLGEGIRELASPEEDGARIFVPKERARPGVAPPLVSDGLLPSAGFAVAYLIAEIAE